MKNDQERAYQVELMRLEHRQMERQGLQDALDFLTMEATEDNIIMILSNGLESVEIPRRTAAALIEAIKAQIEKDINNV